MSGELTLGLLKQAIHDLQRSVNESNKTNKVIAINELIQNGTITKEEALTNDVYREFVESLKKDNQTVIKANVKRR